MLVKGATAGQLDDDPVYTNYEHACILDDLIASFQRLHNDVRIYLVHVQVPLRFTSLSIWKLGEEKIIDSKTAIMCNISRISVTSVSRQLAYHEILLYHLLYIITLRRRSLKFISLISDWVKVPHRSFELHWYLTGVTAAELRQHSSNMNVIFNR